MSNEIEVQGIPNGPPTYEEATNLPGGPSSRENTPLLGNRGQADNAGRHFSRRPPAQPQATTAGQSAAATRNTTNNSGTEDYDVQSVVRFWLGLSYADPQSNTCSGYASLLCRFVFVLLFIWGMIIILLTVLKGGGQKFYDTCSEFFTIIVLTYLGGLSFVLCFLYCVCVHFWECCGSGRNRTGDRRSRRDFTVCGALAWIISIIFMAVLGGLATWIGEHSDYVVYGCNGDETDDSSSDSVLCSCQKESGEVDSPFYMLPLWTAGSMAAIMFVCGVVNIFGCCVAAFGCRRHRPVQELN